MTDSFKKTATAKGYKESNGMVQIAVRVPDYVFNDLKYHALRTGQSISSLIREELKVAVEYMPEYEGFNSPERKTDDQN